MWPLYTYHHLLTFLLTFFSYVLLHASRKTFSNVKVSISAQWTPSALQQNATALSPAETWEENALFADMGEATLFLGALDSIFLFSYAVGLYISGVIGDRFNLRYVLSFGLCGSAITTGCSVLFIIPLLFREIQSLCRDRQARTHQL
ncbi:sugar phosphate exchanger 3 [Danio aesculapii]|uniref:sugar phosphate exchanger 3 n=1 Tax=Danio aesculapii TaxID=1142201 RepID=UPI0024BF58A9|nr:sugar phosphate exchanger 3 [Danio aesculapii]